MIPLLFTAEAALDDRTPKSLNIASFQINPNQLLAEANQAPKSSFSIVPMGSLEKFAEQISKQRGENPAYENELFPAWQDA